MSTGKLRSITLIMALSLAALGFAGCGLAPKNVSLSDPQVQPLLKAMAQVDRASLGFTPVTTNDHVSLELRRAGGTYDAMLHVYGATSRTIAFRKTSSGYRWISEQEIYEGPKWFQSVDGTFREYIVIEYQTEPVNGIPTNQLYIRYTGSDTNLEGREFSLAEVRPILEKWKTSPVEPKPPDIPGSDIPDPLPALLVLLVLITLLAVCFLAVFITVGCLVVFSVMLLAGIISTSVVIGIIRRSTSAGFRSLFIQIGALAGMAGGATATCIVTWIARSHWNSPMCWVIGIAFGALIGMWLAWLFNKLWSHLARALAQKLEHRN